MIMETQVGKPKVILKEVDGEISEPYETVQIECPTDTVGGVIEALGARGGLIENMDDMNEFSRLNYLIPSRGLIGFSTDFLTLTKGYGILSHSFKEYRKQENSFVGERKNGVLVAVENGKATAYAIGQMESRGILFIEPKDEVYEGMVVGENNHNNDLAINVVKSKNLTNMRSASKDSTVVLKRPTKMSLENCLDYINNDELVEVTPKSFRIRKKILDTNKRKKIDSLKKYS